MPLHHLKSVLHLEDEAIIAIDLASLLQDYGIGDVYHAATCEAALNALNHKRFDAAILDVKVGNEDSRVVAEELARRAVPFIFYSGSTADEWVSQINAPWVAKPAVQEEVLAALQSLKLAA